MRTPTLVLLAVLAVGCVRTSTNPVTGKTDVDIESPLKKGEDWKGTLTGMGTTTALSGNTTIAVLNGRTTATVTLNGGTPGMSYPFMIHEGTCSAPGQVVGDMSAYTPITIGQDGTGTATVTLQTQLKESTKYVLAVHASSSDMATIVACGELKD